MSRASNSLRRLSVLLIPGLVALAYGLAHLNWYLDTPLGQIPVLDEREQLNFAEAIHGGILPPEPFYRAPGYALALASFRALGIPAPALFSLALAFGVLLHAANAALIGRITRVFFDRTAGLVAGVLFALHPVFVHYSTQTLDAIPAVTLFLAGLSCIAPAIAGKSAPANAWIHWLGASLFWAAATITRPNYLIVWLTLPVLVFLIESSARRTAWLGVLGGASVFAAVAFWQYRVSGNASFMPTQGVYNLWAANRPGSHGRFYTQQISLTGIGGQENPTRIESALLFTAETGRQPLNTAELNRHWRDRFLREISDHPLTWLGLIARKSYALLNDWEQYNNKTYAFHQARSPWLRWNPISWGMVFVLGVAGAMRLRVENLRVASASALIVAAIALSIVLFFVSARFRLPLAALGVIVAGGALAAPSYWHTSVLSRPFRFIAPLAIAALLTFSSFDEVRDRSTFVQDHVLLARAADTSGDDATAWQESVAALGLQPNHPDATRIAVASFFNLLLIDRAPEEDEVRWGEACERLLNTSAHDALDLRAIAALALWRAGDSAGALAEWRSLDLTPSAVAARIVIKDSVNSTALSKLPSSAWSLPLVRLAAAATGTPPPPGHTSSAFANAPNVAKRLFASRTVTVAR